MFLVIQYVLQLQHTPQHLVRLLQIAVDGNCDLAVRQIASIQFKNLIVKHWSPKDGGQQRILQSDKELVRENILVCVTQVPTLLRADLDKRKAEKERLEEERKNHEMEKLRNDMENSQGGTVVVNTGLKDKYATETMMLEEDDEDFHVEDEEDNDDAIYDDEEDEEMKRYYY